MKDVTLLTCSYNTPEHIETLLKSWVVANPNDDKLNVIVKENSTNDETENYLKENNIPYIRTPGMTHSQSVNDVLPTIDTKYVLLVDSDVIIKQPIYQNIKFMEENGIALMGEVCGDRGGYKLKTRAHPWFCLINNDLMKQHNIKFHDEKRITKTNSNGFYNNIPINRNDGLIKYDVGSTFFEDILEAKLLVANIKWAHNNFIHYEGSSWQGHVSGFENGYNNTQAIFDEHKAAYDDVNIEGKFK